MYKISAVSHATSIISFVIDKTIVCKILVRHEQMMKLTILFYIILKETRGLSLTLLQYQDIRGLCMPQTAVTLKVTGS